MRELIEERFHRLTKLCGERKEWMNRSGAFWLCPSLNSVRADLFDRRNTLRSGKRKLCRPEVCRRRRDMLLHVRDVWKHVPRILVRRAGFSHPGNDLGDSLWAELVLCAG